MPKDYSFTAKHFPVNGLWELDLEQQMNQMAEGGRNLVCTLQLIHEERQSTPQIIIFWGRS